MKILSLTFIVILSASIASCATESPVQPPVPIAYDAEEGTTQSQMLQARFECWKETAQRVDQGGFGVSDGFGGGYSDSKVLPDCSAFSACMAARGYIRDPRGALIVPKSAEINCSN